MSHFYSSARVSLVALAVLVLGCVSLSARALDTSQKYTVQVDYAQAISDSLRAADFTWVNPQVNAANFPESMSGSATLTAQLVPFDAGMSVDNFTKAQAAAGFRPATLDELLAFGKANPQLQKDEPIIALGSSSEQPVLAYNAGPSSGTTRVEARFYPFLGNELFGRTVNLAWTDDNESTPLHTYARYSALVVSQQK
jgi:hypothetical protein